MARGKVITTHLRTGEPNGIRTVFISNKICEMIVFPKSEFEMVSKLDESSRPALYILLGEDENGVAQAYIGETTNGVQRINNHKNHKLFWNKCLMFVAKDNSINKADVLYLERKSIELATDCRSVWCDEREVGQGNIVVELSDRTSWMSSSMMYVCWHRS